MNLVRDMENISVVDANAIRTTMEIGVNIGMNVRPIKIVEYKENALISMERRCQRNNVTAIWDGSALVAIKVSFVLFRIFFILSQ